jgi:hypothetical protein
MFAQMLLNDGFPVEQIRRMTVVNTTALID